jgi:hypothetical protein
MQRLAAALLLTVLAPGPAATQRVELIDDAKLPRFEVASVRRGDPNARPGRVDFPPGRFVQENVPLLKARRSRSTCAPISWPDPSPTW